jgi:hypothetical protein
MEARETTRYDYRINLRPSPLLQGSSNTRFGLMLDTFVTTGMNTLMFRTATDGLLDNHPEEHITSPKICAVRLQFQCSLDELPERTVPVDIFSPTGVTFGDMFHVLGILHRQAKSGGSVRGC